MVKSWTEPLRPDRDQSQLLPDVVNEREDKEKKPCKNEPIGGSLSWKWCAKLLQAKNAQHKRAVNMAWQTVGSHGGAKNIMSAEMQPFCLHRLSKQALRISGSWS